MKSPRLQFQPNKTAADQFAVLSEATKHLADYALSKSVEVSENEARAFQLRLTDAISQLTFKRIEIFESPVRPFLVRVVLTKLIWNFFHVSIFRGEQYKQFVTYDPFLTEFIRRVRGLYVKPLK